MYRNLSTLRCKLLTTNSGCIYKRYVATQYRFVTLDPLSVFNFQIIVSGVSAKVTEAIMSLFEGTTAGVRCQGDKAGEFGTGAGFRQGCILSPLLFSLFINELLDVVDGGCSFGGRRIKILM